MGNDTAKAVTVGARLSKIWDTLLKVTIYVSGVLILILMLLMSYQVIGRYFFNAPGGWVPDFAGYFQYACVLLGTTWVLRNNKHTRIDVIVVRYSRRTQTIIGLVCNFLAFIACALFFWVGLLKTWDAFARGDFLYKEVNMPLGPLYAFIPFAFLLLSIQLGMYLYSGWRSLRTAPAKPSQPSQPDQAPVKPA
jgi:C4-dicarboxylate transporter DctQ subunit